MSPWIAFGLGCLVGFAAAFVAALLWLAGMAAAVDAAQEGQ